MNVLAKTTKIEQENVIGVAWLILLYGMSFIITSLTT